MSKKGADAKLRRLIRKMVVEEVRKVMETDDPRFAANQSQGFDLDPRFTTGHYTPHTEPFPHASGPMDDPQQADPDAPKQATSRRQQETEAQISPYHPIPPFFSGPPQPPAGPEHWSPGPPPNAPDPHHNGPHPGFPVQDESRPRPNSRHGKGRRRR